MATTYAENLIASYTVGSGGTSTVTFSSIPQTYTDLVILTSLRGTSSNIERNMTWTCNGSTSNRASRIVGGTGSGTEYATTTSLFGGVFPCANATASVFGNSIVYITNYTSSNYKSSYTDGMMENNATTSYIDVSANLWSNTSAITSLEFTLDSGNFAQYSTFYLYGITAVPNVAKATGGIITQDSTYVYHTFTSTGTFTPTQSLSNVDFLVVAGGGGGGQGNSEGGGGGAGGLRSTVDATGGGGSLESKLSLSSGVAYTVTVGSGGAGGTAAPSGTSGSNSSIAGTGLTTITSTGGGAGGSSGNVGLNGGSGGGGTYSNLAGGTGTANQGYAGGRGGTQNPYTGGGGGGAGAVGSNASGTTAGAGGNGVTTSISGTSTTYAGGGGGGSGTNGGAAGGTYGAGGSGGGGRGSNGTVGAPVAGTANTGGGGGAGGGTGGTNGAQGGSGVVIIRYAK